MHTERNREEKFELPKDLVAEARKRAAPQPQEFYKVDAFKPSFFGRVAALIGRRR